MRLRSKDKKSRYGNGINEAEKHANKEIKLDNKRLGPTQANRERGQQVLFA